MRTSAPDPKQLQSLQIRRKAVLGLAIIATLAVATVSGPHRGPHEVLEWAGLVMVGICVSGRTWCTLYIGGRKTVRIVQEGPYSVTRNPLYLFSFVGAFGIGAQTGSFLLGVTSLVATVLIFYMTVKGEEAWLKAKFGRPYEAYLLTTPRFWPNLRLCRDADILEVRPNLFVRSLKDGALFFLPTPLFKGLEYAQDVSWVHPWFSLP